MMEFFYHDGIEKEIAAYERRFRGIRMGFSHFERLCNVQFDPQFPKQVITSGKLHRIRQEEVWAMWKIELAVPDCGLRPNQYPRVWFAVKGENIAFLCMSSHIDNYDNTEMETLAFSRITDIF